MSALITDIYLSEGLPSYQLLTSLGWTTKPASYQHLFYCLPAAVFLPI